MAADHRSTRSSGHTRRTSFFSAAAQGETDGLGVVLEALDTSPGDETREAVQVAELLYGWHHPIVTTFLDEEKSESPAFSQVSKEFGRKIDPLDFTKSQKKVGPLP